MRSRAAFTLVELLVVIAIIGILIALLLPAVQAAREAARRGQCLNNLKQIGLATHGFHDAHDYLPPERLEADFATWAVLVLPYMEQQALFETWNLDYRYYDPQQTANITALVPTWLCPTRTRPSHLSVQEGVDALSVTDTPDGSPGTDPRFSNPANFRSGAVSDYAASMGSLLNPAVNGNRVWASPNTNGAIVGKGTRVPTTPGVPATFRGNRGLRDILDGTSNTLWAGEKHVRQGWEGRGKGGDSSVYNGIWAPFAARLAGPEDPLANGPGDNIPSVNLASSFAVWARKFGSWHPGVCQFVFCDGSVRPLKVQISPTTLHRLSVRKDGEAVTLD